MTSRTLPDEALVPAVIVFHGLGGWHRRSFEVTQLGSNIADKDALKQVPR
ncbi:MAG: hypothetical protein ACO1RA_17670 [Planctomycetaceae bacterium]